MTKGPETWSELHDGRLQAMIRVAEAAGRSTLTRFRRTDLEVEAKADDSPVTVADREAEQLVREMLGETFPDDTIQGEEFDETKGTSRYRWIVDPIDGTKSFICGVPLYSTLLALEVDDEPFAGVIFIPACDELIAAGKDLGCWYRGSLSGCWTRATVSKRSRLKDIVFVTSQVDSFDDRGAATAYKALEKAARITRSWGDGYGYLMVATGRADVMVDPVCKPWDVAAIQPVIQEAGGCFTDWQGKATIRGGDGVGTNELLHDQVLKLLAQND